MPGIECPRCGCKDLRDDRGLPAWEVIKTMKGNGHIRRRRRCRHCGKYVYTREKLEQDQ